MEPTRCVTVLSTLAAFVVGACTGIDSINGTGAGSGPKIAMTAAAAPSKNVVLPIAMQVMDAGPSGAYKITSDGLGEYVDGLQGMTVEIDSYGNLQITPLNGTSSTPPQRTLRFDFSAPTDPLNSYRPDESGQLNFKIKTNAVGLPRIQDLGVNGNPASACYSATIAHNNGTTHHRAIFNPASDPSSTRALITRTSISPAAWTMVSDSQCPVTANVAGVWSQDLVRKNAPLVFRGYYNLQFSIQLRAK
jgi:hypothetical protein